MKSITRHKPFDEVKQKLDKFDRVYIVGCGTCTTMTKTGGREEVLDMKEHLQELGKLVTDWTVIPTACDEMVTVWRHCNIRNLPFMPGYGLLTLPCFYIPNFQVAAACDRQLSIPAERSSTHLPFMPAECVNDTRPACMVF